MRISRRDQQTLFAVRQRDHMHRLSREEMAHIGGVVLASHRVKEMAARKLAKSLTQGNQTIQAAHREGNQIGGSRILAPNGRQATPGPDHGSPRQRWSPACLAAAKPRNSQNKPGLWPDNISPQNRALPENETNSTNPTCFQLFEVMPDFGSMDIHGAAQLR